MDIFNIHSHDFHLEGVYHRSRPKDKEARSESEVSKDIENKERPGYTTCSVVVVDSVSQTVCRLV